MWSCAGQIVGREKRLKFRNDQVGECWETRCKNVKTGHERSETKLYEMSLRKFLHMTSPMSSSAST